MLFKRPKTSNNFWFYYSDVWEIEERDDNDEYIHKEEDFDIEWNNTFEDPVYFWYLMQIFELYNLQYRSILLSDIGEVDQYTKATEKHDEEVWDAYSLWDTLFMKDSYSLVVFRLSVLSNLFFSFDIKKIFIEENASDIAKKFMRSYLENYDKISQITDDDLDYIYSICCDLIKMNEDKLIRMHEQESLNDENTPEKSVIGGSYMNDIFEIYPNPDSGLHWSSDKWEKITAFGEFMRVGLDFDDGNMKILQNGIDDYISETFDGENNIEDGTRQFIALAKKSEIIWNVAFVKFEDAIKANFPCLQYIYWLHKTEGGLIKSWKIKDAFAISLFDSTICRILGIWEWSSRQQENIQKLAYNETKEVLELDWKRLSLWETNEAFVREYFDLLFNAELWVSIDEIIEGLEPNIWQLDSDEILKAKKRLGYDRANLLSKKIAKLTGVSWLFKIENGYIKLTSPIRVEK